MMTGEADQIRELTEEAFWSKVHRLRRDNPHEVTIEQTGDVSGIEGRLLTVEAHLTDKDNPHEVTAEQVGATGGGGGASSLLQYHPLWHSADTTTITGLAGGNKWSGGVLGPD